MRAPPSLAQPVIDIDTHVPLRLRGSSKGITDTAKKLRIGESFILPKGTHRQTGYKAARAAGIDVAMRKEGTSYRVWRTA